MAKRVLTALEQNEEDQIEQLDLIDEGVKALRSASNEAGMQAAQAAIVSAIAQMMALKRDYHAQMKAEAEQRITRAVEASETPTANDLMFVRTEF